MNNLIVVLAIFLAVFFLIFLIVKNQKDKKKFLEELNQSELKTERHNEEKSEN